MKISVAFLSATPVAEGKPVVDLLSRCGQEEGRHGTARAGEEADRQGKLAELAAYHLLKGDRAKAEELIDKSFSIESGEVWNTSMIAGGHLGVKPQE
ncbi:MAG TPA: hypothetical protein VEO54_02670 [Thermoanaerobaculia bacterium]|nr:hypothetical protein [Thermoanaerobaculia bacterium]